jgi:LacI family transcriptional regulator
VVQRPTIADLAKAAGVSVATVDRVLNRRLPVRGDTAQRVVAAAETIGYHATGLLKRRLTEIPVRRFGFLLQKRNDAFYQAFGSALVHATKSAREIEGKPIVEFSEELVPSTIAERLRSLAGKCDAVAVVSVDHPIVNGVVEELAGKGIPVFTLLSDVSSSQRASYLAVDSRKAGRTAAWVISRLARRAGKVGILVGSHRYLSQEMAETSFRSYMREFVPEQHLLEPVINLDDDRLAFEAVSELVARNPDLVGIYASGGGQEGFLQALRAEKTDHKLVAVCNELTPVTREALIDGTLDMALGTPAVAIARQAVQLMMIATDAAAGSLPTQVLFPADIHISENI